MTTAKNNQKLIKHTSSSLTPVEDKLDLAPASNAYFENLPQNVSPEQATKIIAFTDMLLKAAEEKIKNLAKEEMKNAFQKKLKNSK